MSGFDAQWLALREPADHAARHPDLLAKAAAHLDGLASPVLVDLGCGTGSTVRAVGSRLPASCRWRLVDHDAALLEAARSHLGEPERFETVLADLVHVEALPLAGGTLVTASALFDLVSGDWLGRFVRRLRSEGLLLYGALNYNGRIAWREQHPLDRPVVEAFNLHQRTDKGFGPALGPQAGPALARLLAAAGFRVETAASDWTLGPGSTALEEVFLTGLVQAVRETARLDETELEAWAAARRRSAGAGCTVGHLDILAAPPAAC